MIKAAVIGGSGLTGRELLKILLRHKYAEVGYITSRKLAGKKVKDEFPELSGMTGLKFTNPSDDEIFSGADVLFACLPHTDAMDYVNKAAQKNKKIIDLSADFRLKDPKAYRKWYKTRHRFPGLLKKAVYGMPEFFREEIKKTSITANPGCYATGMLAGIVPLAAEYNISDIIVDSKSGISGAGAKPAENNMYINITENIFPYKFGRAHRHIGEVEGIIKEKTGKDKNIIFTPQVFPAYRGILTVVYAKIKGNVSEKEITGSFKKFYKGEPFIRFTDRPAVKNTAGTNFIDIDIKYIKENKTVIVVTALDNLIKGASGSAVQNMNLMFGVDETCGLI